MAVSIPRNVVERLSERVSAAIWGQTRRLFRMQSRLRSNELVQIVVCAVAGSAVGVLVTGLHWSVDYVHRVGFRISGAATLSTGLGVDPQRVLIVPVIGGLVLGIGALLMRRYRSNDIVDPIEANALHGGRMSLFDSLRLLVATFASNASGVAIGMEAGYSQLGSGVFSKLGQYFRLRRSDLRIFVGAGSAAAIAAAFNAPLAGAFYGYELILGSYAIRALAPVAAAALAGALTERALMNSEPLFGVSYIYPFSQWSYVLFAVLGVVAAGFSVLAMQAVTWVERGLRRLPFPQWLRPAIGGVLVSGVALLEPQVLGSGHGAIQMVFDNNFTLPALAVILIAKLVASALSLGSGFRGGMFSSSLFLGCLLGGVFANLAAFLVPQLVEQHATLMMVGMGSVAAAVIGAPLTMVFLILEGTGNFPVTVAVMEGVVIASTIVRLTFGYSFSTWRFHQRGIGIRSPHDVGWLADLTAGRLMRADPKTVLETMPIDELREKFPPGSAKRVFVVSDVGAFLGTLDMSAVHDAPAAETPDRRIASDLATDPDVFLLPFENIRTALARFEEKEVEALPVLASGSDRSIVGYLTEQYALRRYNMELERRRSADLGERDLFSISEPPR
jgi:CIC family chloride channel protein